MDFLTIKNVSKNFGRVNVLDDINFSVKEGELVCLLGPSGCGKTTLLRLIAGLEDPNEGSEIYLKDKEITPLRPADRDFGIVFQSYALFPNMTAFQNVAYGLKHKKNSKEYIKDKVFESLSLVNLKDLHDRYPSQLSGGQQQRVALARAIALSPRFLLLDEPLSALDAKVRDELRIQIRNLQKRLGITTIMVTHDQEEALTMGERIVVMNDAKLEQYDTPEAVYDKPITPFVAEFIGTINQFHDDDDNSYIAIRPEHIDIQTESDSETSKAVVHSVEFRGSSSRIYLEMERYSTYEFVNEFLLVDVSSGKLHRLNLEKDQEIYIKFPEKHLLRYEDNKIVEDSIVSKS